MSILIICPYPPKKAPSQRFRFEQYLSGLDCEINQVGFWNNSEWPRIYQSGNLFFKAWRTLMAFLRRFVLLFSVWRYDKVFVHREATPIGPAWFEWWVVKVFRKPLIYDFDDAIWLPNASDANAKLLAKMKSHEKVGRICGWADLIIVGNSFLGDYAKQFVAGPSIQFSPSSKITQDDKPIDTSTQKREAIQDDRVIVIPTTIDTEGLHNRELYTSFDTISPLGEITQDDSKTKLLTIGWTGTHSTLRQLVPLFPLLEEIHQERPFRFLLIADQAPVSMPDFVEFCKWNKETEIPDLMRMDIGIMPLYDTDWERGKCGFKALQYMALEIPTVVSAVGVNTEIITQGIEGLITEPVPVGDGVKWKDALMLLLKDDKLRVEMGDKGRKRILEGYSVEAWKGVYEEVFRA